MGNETSSIADLKPGDLIEIHRPGYKHWGVYVGHGFIVHITAPDGISSSGSGMFSSSNCGTVVKKEKLDVVAGKDSWNIGNYLDKNYQPRPADVIVKEALELVGQTFNYEITTQNCEHFSNFLRYGKKKSGQVDTAMTGVAVAGGIIAGLAAVAFVSRSSEDKTTTTIKKKR